MGGSRELSLAYTRDPSRRGDVKRDALQKCHMHPPLRRDGLQVVSKDVGVVALGVVGNWLRNAVGRPQCLMARNLEKACPTVG